MDLDRIAGRVRFTDGQLVQGSDMNNVGGSAHSSLYGLIALLFGPVNWLDGESVAASGIPDGSFLEVVDDGSLNLSVTAGYGFLREPEADSPSGSEFQAGSYVPIVLVSNTALSMTTPSNYPRWDIVFAKSLVTEDLPENRFIKTVGIASTLVNTRSRFAATVGVSEGVDGTLTTNAPSGPEAHLELARVYHSSPGVYVVHDSRPFLQLSGSVTPPLPKNMVQNHVASRWNTTSSSLQVSASSPSSMYVLVPPGAAVIEGQNTRVRPALPILASDPSDDRISIVAAKATGAITILEGVPASSPEPPTVTDDVLPLAQVYIAAGATTIESGDITDLRKIDQWLDPNSLRRPAEAEHVKSVYWIPTASPTVDGDDSVTMPGALVYHDGSPYNPPVGENTTVRCTLRYELAVTTAPDEDFTTNELATYDGRFTGAGFAVNVGLALSVSPTYGLPYHDAYLDFRENSSGVAVCYIRIKNLNSGSTPSSAAITAFILDVQVLTQASVGLRQLPSPVCTHRIPR